MDLLQYPKPILELRPFLDLRNLYLQFVPNITTLDSQSSIRLKSGEPLLFELEVEKRKTVDILKIKLFIPHVLVLPRVNGQYRIDTDGCGTQDGCVLLQGQKYKALKAVG